MSCIGSDKGNPSCTFSYESKADTLGSSNGAVDGYHVIEGVSQAVKPVINSDMSSPDFLKIVEIRTIGGDIIEPGSAEYQLLTSPNNSEFIELHDRSIMGVKYYAEKNGVLSEANEAANNSGNGVRFDHLHTGVYENAVNNIGNGAMEELYFTKVLTADDITEDNKLPIELRKYTGLTEGMTYERGKRYGIGTGTSDLIATDEFDGGSSSDDTQNVQISNDNIANITKEESDEVPPPEDTENSLKSLFKLAPVLKYPSDAAFGPGGQDYLRIETFKYKPPMPGAFGEGGNSNSLANVVSRGQQRSSNLGDYGNTIKLPIPNDLRVSNGVEWGGAKANAIEMAAMTGMTNTAAGVVDNGIVSTIMKSFGSMSDLASRFGDLGVADGGTGQALTAFVSKLALSKLNINVDTNQFVARSNGIAINPNLELLFSSPKLRNFTFRFDFAPNDEVDARNSRMIMRIFKQGMVPTGYGSKDGSSSIFIGSPMVYRIGYFNGTNRIRGLPIHKICALTQCSINFTPENVYQSYSDDRAVSNPVRSTMELAFTELTPVFAEDYNMNFLDEKEGELSNSSLTDLAQDSGEGGLLQGDNEMNKYDIGY